MKKKYRVFTRTWWRENGTWPDGLEPHTGRKTTLGYTETEEQARAWCEKYNRDNDPGRLLCKAEYELY